MDCYNNTNTKVRSRSSGLGLGLTYKREESFVVEFAQKSTKPLRKGENTNNASRGLQEAFLTFKKRRQHHPCANCISPANLTIPATWTTSTYAYTVLLHCCTHGIIDLRQVLSHGILDPPLHRDALQQKLMKERALSNRCDELCMLHLRKKFLDQAKQYFGVPYKRKYHEPGSMEYNSPIFLDCCGLVRRVLRDLKEDFGFTIGPWNQAYQFDTLPVIINEEKAMQPGDLVFISGIYNDPKRKKQKHNMVHVEIWAGDGTKTIGARWQKGKVQVHDSYCFEAKSYHSMVYHFRSIDTWLQGICKSFCQEHPWKCSTFQPSKRSVFSLDTEGWEEDEYGEISQEDTGGTSLEEEDPGETVNVGDTKHTKVTDEPVGKTQLGMVRIGMNELKDDGNRQNLMHGAMNSLKRSREIEQVVSLLRSQSSKEAGQYCQHDKTGVTKEEGGSSFGIIEEFCEKGDELDGSAERKLNDEEEKREEVGTEQSVWITDITFEEKFISEMFSCEKTELCEVEDLEVEEDLITHLERDDDEGWLYDSGLENQGSSHPFIAWDDKNHERENSVAKDCFSEPPSTTGWQISSLDRISREKSKEFQGQTSKRMDEFIDEFAATLHMAESVSDQDVTLHSPAVLEKVSEVDATSVDELEEMCLSDVELRHGDYNDLSHSSAGWNNDEVILSMEEYPDSDTVLKPYLSPSFSLSHSLQSNLHQVMSCHKETSQTDSDSPKDPSGQPSSGGSLANQQSEERSGGGQLANQKTGGTSNRGNDDSQDGREKRKSNAEGRKSLHKTEAIPLFYIGGKNGVSLVEEPLLAKGWQKLEDSKSDKYKLRWVEIRSQINYSSFRPGEQLINRIPGSGMLATKTGLFKTLRDYERFNDRMKRGQTDKGMRMQDFFPESYILDNKADRDAFFQIYKEGEIWICKPNNMNQGKGIYLVRDLEELKKKYCGEATGGAVARSRMKRGTNQRLIQRYLPNPLLLNGKKFDVRTYMLIACTNPFVVLYHSGYCRLSCEDYDAESQDLARHLTNQYQQKRVATYQDMKNETVWSMERFSDYINTEIAEKNGLPADWVFSHFTKRMHQIMTHCFHAVKNKLDTSLGLFDLLGFDFIIDTDMKIWLLEVNVNPALHTNCDVLKEKLPPMIAETLDLTLEIFEKSQKKQKILPLKSLKNFHLLYSATSGGSRHVRPQRTKSTSPTRADRKPISPSRVKGSKSTVPPKSSSPSKVLAGAKGLTPKATPTVIAKDSAENS